MKKLLFVPDFILTSNPHLKKFQEFDNFVDFEKFLEYSNKNFDKNFLESLDKESLDKEVFNELGFGKYKKYISYDQIKFSSEKILKDINPLYNPKQFKDVGIRKSIVLKSQYAFVIQFVENTYLVDNFNYYLVESDKINADNFLSYKFLFKSRFKYDFLTNLISYSNNIIDYNRYHYNYVIDNMPKIRPRRINNLLKMILSDMDKHLGKSIFFYRRESRQIIMNLEKFKGYNSVAYELLLDLNEKIKDQINFISNESINIKKVKTRLERNIFILLWDKRPKLKRIGVRASPSTGEISGEIEFKD